MHRHMPLVSEALIHLMSWIHKMKTKTVIHFIRLRGCLFLQFVCYFTTWLADYLIFMVDCKTMYYYLINGTQIN